MAETNDFPTHARLGLPLPEWGTDTDSIAIRIPWSPEAAEPAVTTALIAEQLRGFLAAVGLNETDALVDATIADLAKDYLVDFDNPAEEIEITNARALLAMDRIEEGDTDPREAALVVMARDIWARINDRPIEMFDTSLRADERTRWIEATRPAFDSAIDWRERHREERRRSARANKLARWAAEMRAEADWLTTEPLPVDDSFNGEPVRYVGTDDLIKRRFATFGNAARGSGNGKWTCVTLGNGADAVDVPTRDLTRA